jgi:uncharacterized membrane protein YkoI
VRLLLTLISILPLVVAPASAEVFDLEQSLRETTAPRLGEVQADFRVAQNGNGMSLSQAIESVRRQTGGQIVSATTKVSNGQETHHIKVLTKDGKVKTVKVPGRKVGGG